MTGAFFMRLPSGRTINVNAIAFVTPPRAEVHHTNVHTMDGFAITLSDADAECLMAYLDRVAMLPPEVTE